MKLKPKFIGWHQLELKARRKIQQGEEFAGIEINVFQDPIHQKFEQKDILALMQEVGIEFKNNINGSTSFNQESIIPSSMQNTNYPYWIIIDNYYQWGGNLRREYEDDQRIAFFNLREIIEVAGDENIKKLFNGIQEFKEELL